MTAALLIRYGFVSLEDLYPHVSVFTMFDVVLIAQTGL
jgi:hypothetical protein